MGDTSKSIETHYTHGGLLKRIFTALERAGHETCELTPEILGPIEHLHTGGLGFTKEQAEKVGFTSGMQVLDLGCGVGGPARYIGSAYGCNVVGIDLTAEFIEVADELTKRCGLTEKVSFQQGNALDLPFENERFDVVFCQNLTMNIHDKSGMFREVHRILRPGGKFTSVDHTQGPTGDPYYPIGWANTPEISFLVSPKEMRRLLEQSGFRIVDWTDCSAKVLELAHKAREAAKSSSTNPLGLHVVLGEDYPERQRNLQRSLQENRLVYVMVTAERT
jgi:ubiquinone/menaquinone biosynthesis C-methylase UbiE